MRSVWSRGPRLAVLCLLLGGITSSAAGASSIAAIEMHHTDAMFDTSQRSNPFAADARRAFIEVLSTLDEEIVAGHLNFRNQAHADPSALQADHPLPELAPE